MLFSHIWMEKQLSLLARCMVYSGAHSEHCELGIVNAEAQEV